MSQHPSFMHGPAIAMLAAAAMMSAGLGGGYGDRYVRREFTLEEEEEQSVRRMLSRARHRRSTAERELRRAAEAEVARIAAEKEAARPKSRQELRALARTTAPEYNVSGGLRRNRQSDSLKRLLAKAR